MKTASNMVNFLVVLLAVFIGFGRVAHSQEVVIPRISPVPAQVSGLAEVAINLDGDWLFDPSYGPGFIKNPSKDNWSAISVPGEWAMQGFNVDSGATAAYYRAFMVPGEWEGKRIKLRFNAVYSESTIYVNDRMAGSHHGGFTAFELDVSNLVHFGSPNQLLVMVKNESLENSLSSGSRYACHPLGGISRSVSLMALPEVHMSALAIRTQFDNDFEDATLTARIEICNEGESEVSGFKLLFELAPWQSNLSIPLSKNQMETGPIEAGGNKKLEFSVPVEAPAPWNCETPNLYVLTCHLVREGNVLESLHQRFGFRQSEVIGNQLFINGKPVKLRGVNRHEVYPLTGRVVPAEMYRKDIELFREGNVNHIRTCHYPPDEKLMEAADELGMFIECEGPFCWSHETAGDSTAIRKAILNQELEMVVLYRNHPSIIFWSIANESVWNKDFEYAAKAMAALDPTRPLTFNYFPWGWVENQQEDETVCAIGSDHYPSPSGPAKYSDFHRPINFGEFVHLNAYNRYELATDVALRDLWGTYLHKMWENMYLSQGVVGGSIWAGIDDTFYWDYPLEDGTIEERTVGYGTWGPIDGWRRKKPEWWGMKKTYSPVRISEPKWEGGKMAVFEIENRQDFSNLNRLDIQWKVGKESGNLRINLAPKEKGRIVLGPLPQQDLEANLELVFMDPRGFMVDSFDLPIQPHLIRYETPEIGTATTFRMGETSDNISVTINQKEYLISKITGHISCDVFTGPSLMILPLNRGGDTQMHGPTKYYEPYTQTCTDWKLESTEKQYVDGRPTVKVRGSYKEASGSYTYTFGSSGGITIDYDFKSAEEVSPRQLGMVLDLPKSLENLSWKRKGYWTTYPEWHIARLEGTVKSSEGFEATPVGPRTKPEHEWRLDRTAIGSNDFASTKHNVYWTTILDNDGVGLKVLGQAKQHTRSWIEGESIRLLIADYSNGGSERFLRPHAEVDDRSLKIGDEVVGSVTLNFIQGANEK